MGSQGAPLASGTQAPSSQWAPGGQTRPSHAVDPGVRAAVRPAGASDGVWGSGASEGVGPRLGSGRAPVRGAAGGSRGVSFPRDRGSVLLRRGADGAIGAGPGRPLGGVGGGEQAPSAAQVR